MRSKQESIEEGDKVVRRIRDFLRLNYMSAAEIAKRIGVTDFVFIFVAPGSD